MAFWTDIFGATLTPKARFAQDLSILREFQHKSVDARFPQGLGLQWLGTAGFKFTYEGFTLLIDPYFTRSPMRAIASRGVLKPNVDAIRAHVSAADAILVGHTHFDHAIDVPIIARLFDAKAYGSSSLRTLMALHGLAEKSVEVDCGKVYNVGPFEVTFISSVHSKLIAGLAVPSGGEFTCDNLDDLSAGHYHCGHTYGIHIKVAGVTFYHQGSANLVDENVIHRNIDYFLAGIAGRGFTPRYMERILTKLNPRVIIPHHFDDFFRQLGEPTGFSFNINMEKFAEEVRAVSKDFEIRTLDLLESIEARESAPRP
jgi:L-ascorbate metabolism protein UlaG (beta-lactamase superfamily)